MSDLDASQPFAGIHVVEFGQFVAVPFCAQILAEGGAEVIKVETLAGDPVRALDQLAPGETRTFLSRNRGKRSLPLALRHPGAGDVVSALLAQADVVLMNFRPGLAQELGLAPDELRQRYPQLVIGTVTPFGQAGPDAGLAGMDIVVQARSGLMVANGRTDQGRPASGDPVSSDYMCAMTLAFGITAALLRRTTTGQGATVDTSLMQAALVLNNTQMLRVEGVDGPVHEQARHDLARLREAGADYARCRESLPSSRALPMRKVYFRTYSTRDGWVAIACGSPRLRARFMGVVGLDDPALDRADFPAAEAHYDRLSGAVEQTMQMRSTREWEEACNTAGIPASDVKFPIELLDDPQAAANGMFHDCEHPPLGRIRVLAPPVRLDSDGVQPAPPPAPFGSETRTILSNLGFDDATVEELIRGGVTREIG